MDEEREQFTIINEKREQVIILDEKSEQAISMRGECKLLYIMDE